MRLRDKLKTYLHYHNVEDQRPWQGGDLPWKAPTHKIIRPFSHVFLQDHVASGRLKPLCIHYHSAYGHHIWQDGDFPWGALTHKVTRPLDHVVLHYLMIN